VFRVNVTDPGEGEQVIGVSENPEIFDADFRDQGFWNGISQFYTFQA
jgi:hypothetical protein